MPDAPDPRHLVHRRGPDGRMEVGPDWETLIERKIREAMEAGQFDNLPFQGEPLPDDDNPYAGDKAIAFHLLKGQGYAPPWIAADKEARELLERRDAILARAAGPAPSSVARARDRAELDDLVPRINAAIARVNAEAPSDRQHRRLLAAAEELARYDDACRR
jgi:DnaJ homolog subfamily C member 28